MRTVTQNLVRFSYVNVFEAKSFNGENAKYSLAILIPKMVNGAPNPDVEAFKKAISETAKEKWGANIPKGLKNIMRDGDTDKDGEEYEGHYFINAKSNNRPQVVDAKGKQIFDKDDVYSGCYGKVSINFFAYDFNGSKGVSAGLGNVMKVEDGARLAGGSSAAQDFGIATTEDDIFN